MGSLLEISANAAEHAIVVELADRGPGLAAGSEKRIFEKFYRGQHDGPPGAGLGLAICLGIAHAHEGALLAENRPGGGAVFRLTLPQRERPPSVPPEADSDPAAEPAERAS